MNLILNTIYLGVNAMVVQFTGVNIYPYVDWQSLYTLWCILVLIPVSVISWYGICWVTNKKIMSCY